jgi:hypothetical protein
MPANGTWDLTRRLKGFNYKTLDAATTVLLVFKISSTCFGQTNAHLQERKTEIFYTNIWYNVLFV